MKLAAIDTAIVSLPLDRVVVTPIHHITTVDTVLVTARTDDGIEGIAYLWCFGHDRARSVAASVRDLAGFAIGTDPRATATLWSRLWRETNFLGHAGIAMLAHSAIDTALWDIRGKALGEPLWRLLGGTRRPVPVYAGGLFLSDPLPAIVAEAKGYVERGFKAMKMRTGAPRAADDIERVAAVREAIGPDVELMIDVVQGWTAERAIKIGREIERYDLTWIEDPVLFDDHAGLAQVAAALDTPVCAGESDYSKLGFRRLIEGRCVDIAMPDLQRAGGITEWMKIAALAEAFGVRVTPHVFQEISVQLMCAIPNGHWCEYIGWWEVLFREPLPLVDGCLEPADRPGIGMEFDWHRLDALRI